MHRLAPHSSTCILGTEVFPQFIPAKKSSCFERMFGFCWVFRYHHLLVIVIAGVLVAEEVGCRDEALHQSSMTEDALPGFPYGGDAEDTSIWQIFMEQPLQISNGATRGI